MASQFLIAAPLVKLFTDPKQFKSIFFGSIYIGDADKDPLDPSHRQQVYIVDESNVRTPVSQPIPIGAGGYAEYNGHPAKFVCDNQYSIVVLDKVGAEKWRVPNIGSIDISQALHNDTKERDAPSAHPQYRESATVAKVESGVFSVGDRLAISDRKDASFNVVDIGSNVVNGFDVLDAGTGKVALLQLLFINHVEHFGCKSDWDFTSETGSDNSDAASRAFEVCADAGAILVSAGGGGYACTTHGIVMKSNLHFVNSKGSKWVQAYQVIVEPKSESLFINESWNKELDTDYNITVTGLNIVNASFVTGGSFFTVNKIEDFTLTSHNYRKTSENIAMNIGGRHFTISDIKIVNKPDDVGKIDGLHCEYVEDGSFSFLDIESQDDALAFAYFPAIVPPRTPAEAIANVPWGRNLTSRNITVSNSNLKSKIANGIRVGNWANFEDLNQYYMPDGRYENLVFSNININKQGTTGTSILLEDYRHGASEITEPHNEVRFNNIVVNDFTSDTESMVSIRGNAFVRGFFDYATAGDDRTFKNVYFNGLSGGHNSGSSTYDFYGAELVSMIDCNVSRTVAANNEIITQLVDSVQINASDINSNALSATGNACFFRDFKEVIISGGKIEGNGLEVAGVRLQQPNVGDVGRVNISGTAFRNVIGGVYAVSALELESIHLDADFSSISGGVTNSLLTNRNGDRGKFTNINPSAAASTTNECRNSGGVGTASLGFTVNSTIASSDKIADFANGCEPSHDDPVRINIINDIGNNFVCDYSASVGLRARASIPTGNYYANFTYRAKG